MVYAPAPALVDPSLVHHTSITSTITATASTPDSSTATATTTATRAMATPGSGTTPLSSGTTSNTTTAAHLSLGHSTCNTSCKAILGVVIPVVLLSLIAIIVYFAWGRNFVKQRKEKRAKAVEDGIAMRKLGDEGSVSEWEGDGDMRDVEIGEERVKKPETAR